MANIIFLFLRNSLLKHWLAAFLLTAPVCSFSQTEKGFLKGKVIDGSTSAKMYNANVSIVKKQGAAVLTSVTGEYFFKLNKGTYSIVYAQEGFQTKQITGIKIKNGSIFYLDIILYPIATENKTSKKRLRNTDSLSYKDTVIQKKISEEINSLAYNQSGFGSGGVNDVIGEENINSGNDKNSLLLIKRLNGVVIEDNIRNPLLHSFIISGMGNRYNQLMFNGSLAGSSDPLNNAYPLALIPAEILSEATLQKTGDVALPANFAGGTVGLKTKDIVDRNFFYIQAGIGYTEGTTGNNFYGDSRSNLEFLGYAGKQRELPSSFPTSRSEYNLEAKNTVEQVYLSRQLKNNLAPQNFGNSKPNEKILFGFGKKYQLKSGAKISLTGFINHTKTEQLNESVSQVMPNVAENPYPFDATSKVLISSQSMDSQYNFSAQTSAVFNASIVYGKSKISFRNFLGTQLNNAYTKSTGIFSAGYDSLAHTGIRYATTQQYFINTQLAGEHILSSNGKFRLDWQATYAFINQQNPDERNFLLRTDSVQKNLFEIAAGTGFTINNRQWRQFKDNNFTGAFNLSFPFNLFNRPQLFTGGIYIQQNFRVFNSDIYQVQGSGFVTTDKLLAPERYYPGGVNITGFYSKPLNSQGVILSPTLILPFHRPDYSASANLGASYFKLNARLTNQLSINLGARVESNSQVASNLIYLNAYGFRYPQSFPIDENTRVNATHFLPSVSLGWTPLEIIKISGGYFKTLNRPQLQELVKYAHFDAATFMVTTGNPLLATASIDNYTAAASFLIGAFSNITFSGFYKKIDQPIEYIAENYGVGSMIASPHNAPPATVKGLEANFKLKFSFLNTPVLNNLTIFGNGNITQSKATAGPLRSTSTPNITEHTLTGTPNYMFNTGLILQQPNLPGITILYNRTGDYISIVGTGLPHKLSNGNTVLAIPDYRVKGREQLDIQISQKLLKSKVQIIAGVNNLTANPYIQYQDLNGDKKFTAPLILKTNGANTGGYYTSGTDNTVISVNQKRIYYITLSYLFK